MSTMTQWLTASEAARHLKASRRTVTRLARAGQLEYVAKAPGIRGAYLFDSAQIESLAAEREKAAS